MTRYKYSITVSFDWDLPMSQFLEELSKGGGIALADGTTIKATFITKVSSP